MTEECMTEELKESEISKPWFFSIIPASVRYCKELEPSAKIFYGEITALCSAEGYCWASNDYFQKMYEVSTRTIQRWLNSLEKLNFIRVELTKKGMKTERKIFLGEGFLKNPYDATKMSCSPSRETTRQKCHARDDKNVIHNNTVTNNTKNKTSDVAVDLSLFLFSGIKNRNSLVRERTPSEVKKWDKTIDLMLNVDKRTPEMIKQVIDYLEWCNINSETVFNWADVVLSADKLRKHFPTIAKQMMKKPAVEVKKEQENRRMDLIENNKKLAQEFKNRIKAVRKNDFIVNDHNISMRHKNDSWSILSYTEHGFSDQLDSNLRKMGFYE